MYKDSELTQATYKLNQVAKMLNVTPTTLRNWEKSEKLSSTELLQILGFYLEIR